MANIDLVKKLRLETGVSIALCNKALNEAGNDLEKAKKILLKMGLEIVGKKSGNQTSQGAVMSYIHHNKRMGALVLLQCETDFVAVNEEFQKVAAEIAMQVASMDPKNVEELLEQDYIRDNSKKISDLVNELIAKLGENITIANFTRYAI